MVQLNAPIKCSNYVHQLNAPIKCSNYVHQLNASDLLQFSPNDFSSIRSSSYSIHYFYGTWDLEKKIQLALDLQRKKLYSRSRLQYIITMMHGFCKNQSHWTISEK